jgi:hypothetical protein
MAKHLGAPHALLLLGMLVLISCAIFFFLVIVKVKPQQPAVADTVPSAK